MDPGKPRLLIHGNFFTASESPLREAVTALSAPDSRVVVAPDSPAAATAAGGKPMHRQTAHDLWALLLERIYAAFPLICPRGGGAMRISAFLTAALMVQKILVHLGEPTSAPRRKDRQTRNRRNCLLQQLHLLAR